MSGRLKSEDERRLILAMRRSDPAHVRSLSANWLRYRTDLVLIRKFDSNLIEIRGRSRRAASLLYDYNSFVIFMYAHALAGAPLFRHIFAPYGGTRIPGGR